MQFRKKPVVIEAVKIRASHWQFSENGDWPDWVQDAIDAGRIQFDNDGIMIQTLEGTLHGASGDMLIQGVQGELYSCKADIFAATYEAVISASPVKERT